MRARPIMSDGTTTFFPAPDLRECEHRRPKPLVSKSDH